ncbi:MAG TPA: hypothetical protein VN915_16395 [Elusimicrobiota bacterium]|nr:hypothetical protein [Elusimicrobiota bacterium]
MSSLPAALTDVILDSKIRFFSDIGLWPRVAILDHRSWLENFKGPDEKKMAQHLLNAFLFFSEELTKQIATSAVHSVSCDIVISRDDPARARTEWKDFLDQVLIIAVGDKPNAADSGNLFARYIRDRYQISEDRVLTAKQALEQLVSKGPMPAIFVDDFVGSGEQFTSMWKKIRVTSAWETYESFSNKNLDWTPFYCPAIATEFGASIIASDCPRVKLRAGNTLSAQYNALDPDSILWPDELRPKAIDFIKSVSTRAGIPDSPGDVDDWRGFSNLGLAIAFAHGIPDGTLPIFRWNKNGWRPLIKK